MSETAYEIWNDDTVLNFNRSNKMQLAVGSKISQLIFRGRPIVPEFPQGISVFGLNGLYGSITLCNDKFIVVEDEDGHPHVFSNDYESWLRFAVDILDNDTMYAVFDYLVGSENDEYPLRDQICKDNGLVALGVVECYRGETSSLLPVFYTRKGQ